MDFETLKKKPATLIMENHVLDDMVYCDDEIGALFTKIDQKIHGSFRDFIIVIINSREEHKVQYIITYKEFTSFMTIFNTFIGYSKKGENIDSKKIESKINDLSLDQFSIKKGTNAIESNDTVQRAINILNDNKLEVLAVVDKKDNYLGKIKRSSLKEKIGVVIY